VSCGGSYLSIYATIISYLLTFLGVGARGRPGVDLGTPQWRYFRTSMMDQGRRIKSVYQCCCSGLGLLCLKSQYCHTLLRNIKTEASRSADIGESVSRTTLSCVKARSNAGFNSHIMHTQPGSRPTVIKHDAELRESV
jgi:hypothetical protein